MSNENVGYKRPPVHNQFKDGNRANPLGRGAGQQLKPGEIVLKVVNAIETVTIGGKNQRMTRIERIVRRFGHEALRGNVASAALLLALRNGALLIGDINHVNVLMAENDQYL